MLQLIQTKEKDKICTIQPVFRLLHSQKECE